MKSPFETLLDELAQVDANRRMAKALQRDSGRLQLARSRATKQQMSKAISDLQGLQRQVTKETTLAKAQRLRQLYTDARAEMAGAIGRLPATDISAMEAKLARAGEQLHAAGIL